MVSVVTGGLSLAGVALHLNSLVKERRWEPPPALTQAAIPLINFQWTDLSTKHGFAQVSHLYPQRAGGTMNPCKLTVDANQTKQAKGIKH